MTEPTRLAGRVATEPHAGTARIPPALAVEDDIGLLELANMVLKRRRFVIGLPIIAGVVTAVIVSLIPPTYRAITSLVPESRTQNRLPTGVTSLVGQLGIPLGVDASQSPRFYADVLKSRAVLEQVSQTRYPDPRTADPRDSTTLLVLLHQGGMDRADSLYRAARKLYDLVSVGIDNQTNIMRLAVDLRYPLLASQVANSFVQYLNNFNSHARQSQARERRKFAEAGSAEAQQALATAEDKLRDFRDRNRRWQESAPLLFQEASLRRQVMIQQEVYLTMRRDLESARIDEVNETPVITVIDSAAVPHQKVKPLRTLAVLVAVLLAGALAVVIALAAGFAERAGGNNSEEYRQFRDLLEGTRSDLRRLLRLPASRRS